jgi:hypothetical protein
MYTCYATLFFLLFLFVGSFLTAIFHDPRAILLSIYIIPVSGFVALCTKEAIAMHKEGNNE